MALIPVRIFYSLIADYLLRLISQEQQTDWECAGKDRAEPQNLEREMRFIRSTVCQLTRLPSKLSIKTWHSPITTPVIFKKGFIRG
jgi:hypothetical protein